MRNILDKSMIKVIFVTVLFSFGLRSGIALGAAAGGGSLCCFCSGTQAGATLNATAINGHYPKPFHVQCYIDNEQARLLAPPSCGALDSHEAIPALAVLDHTHTRLIKEAREKEALKAENDSLKRENRFLNNSHFLNGCMVVGVSVLVGMVIGAHLIEKRCNYPLSRHR
jgi:hypothetical protein